MTTTNISPEFNYNNVNGTLTMIEKKSFMCSKLLNAAECINIDSNNLIYYQLPTNEQLNLSIESALTPIIYDVVGDKLANSTLAMDNSQTTTQQNNNTKWILTIDMKTLLTNYLFNTLKQYRTFEGVQNTMVLSNDVNSAITDYINNNIISLYQLATFSLYLSYNNLNTTSGLRYNNTWDQKIELPSNLVTSYQKIINPTTLQLTVNFSQAQSSATASFNYYYDLYFAEI